MRVALTFDAEHPSRPGHLRGATEGILDILGAAQVRATFFVQGRWARAHPKLVARMAREGHLVGNHSHHHAPMTALTADGLRADVTEAERAIQVITGADPRPWFRCPFGLGHDDAGVLAALKALGYRNVHWDALGLDWEEHRGARAVTESVVDGVRPRGDGAIVLLHAWPTSTSAALPGIIERLREQGAALVGVDEIELVPHSFPPR